MSAALDRSVDPAALAARGWRWSGETPLREWPRLASLDPAGEAAGRTVSASVAWRENEQGVPLLEGELDLRLGAVCQRCLEAMEVELHVQPKLFFGDPARMDPALEEAGFEGCELEPGATLRQLLEDEVLLSVPAFPVHQHKEDCGALAEELAQLEPGKAGRSGSSPFAVLAELKRKN
jgi:uncharacterized protein